MYKQSDIDIDKDSIKILIVDDQIFNIDALMVILEHGVKIDVNKYCRSAFSGKKAI